MQRISIARGFVYVAVMEIKKGWFAEVKYEGALTTVFIVDTQYYDGKLYTAICRTVDGMLWQKAFLPEELLRTWRDPTHPFYLQWKQTPKPKPLTKKTSIKWDWNVDEDSKGRYWE